MSNLVEINEKDFNYLKELDLDILKKYSLYFDYDLIMNSISLTPIEIASENDYKGLVLTWFNDLLFNELEYFYDTDITGELTKNMDPYAKVCPLNDRESMEYKAYVNYKKVLAFSIKAILDDKKELINDSYIAGIDTPCDNEEVIEFRNNLNKMTDGAFLEKWDYANLIDLDDSLKIYKKVLKDKKKPEIKDKTTLGDIMDIIIDYSNKVELDDYGKAIIDYLASVIDVDDLWDGIKRSNVYGEINTVTIIFAAQGLVDSRKNVNYAKHYEKVLRKKKDPTKELDEKELTSYKGTDIYDAVKGLDNQLTGNLETINNLDNFCRNIIFNNNRYSNLKKNEGLSEEVVKENNNKYFNREDFGKKITFKLVNGDKETAFTNKVTKEEMESDTKKVKEAQEALDNLDKELEERKELADTLDKLLHEQDLSEEELNLLDKYGINGDLTTNELETKISLVVARLNELENTKEERKEKQSALAKVSDILNLNNIKDKAIKKSKDLVNFVKNKVGSVDISKKQVLVNGALSILSSGVGANLALILGPAGIVLVNAVVAPIATQAFAYANTLEESELKGKTVEIESINKSSNKLVKKVNSFLRKSHLKKLKDLADFNIFAKLASSKNDKVSKIFSNKEVVKRIGLSLTAGLIGMDLMAFSRALNNMAVKANNKPNPGKNPGSASNGAVDSNTVNKVNYADPKPAPDVKLGQTIGTENKITVGYKTSYDAKLGINPVKLNQNIMYDGNSIIKEAYYYQNGVMKKLAVNANNLTETIKTLGIKPEDVVVNLAKNSGEGRAWVTGEVAAKSLGLTLVP